MTFDLRYASVKDLKLVKTFFGLLPAKRVAAWCVKSAPGNAEGARQHWDYMLGNYALSPARILEELTRKTERWRRRAGGA